MSVALFKSGLLADWSYQMFSILNEIKDSSSVKTTGVVTASTGSAGLIYILVAVTGYLSFGNDVAGNIIGMCESAPLPLFT